MPPDMVRGVVVADRKDFGRHMTICMTVVPCSLFCVCTVQVIVVVLLLLTVGRGASPEVTRRSNECAAAWTFQLDADMQE